MGGKCVICGVITDTEKDCICGDCGNPMKIIMTCTVCGGREDFTRADANLLEAAFHKKIEIGTSIATKGCDKCHPGITKARINIYHIRPSAAA